MDEIKKILKEIEAINKEINNAVIELLKKNLNKKNEWEVLDILEKDKYFIGAMKKLRNDIQEFNYEIEYLKDAEKIKYTKWNNKEEN